MLRRRRREQKPSHRVTRHWQIHQLTDQRPITRCDDLRVSGLNGPDGSRIGCLQEIALFYYYYLLCTLLQFESAIMENKNLVLCVSCDPWYVGFIWSWSWAVNWICTGWDRSKLPTVNKEDFLWTPVLQDALWGIFIDKSCSCFKSSYSRLIDSFRTKKTKCY